MIDLESIPYVHARHQWPRRTSEPHKWIVLHSIEALETNMSAENCANYFATTDRVASTQFVCDVDSTIRCLHWNNRGAAAVGANDEGWHIEQAGFARQTAAEWRDPYSITMIRGQVAPLVAALAARSNIPLRFVDAAGLKRGERGVTTHHECWKAFGGDVRTDPGPNYPMDELLAEARRLSQGPSPSPTPQEDEDDEMRTVMAVDKRDGKVYEFEQPGLFKRWVANPDEMAMLQGLGVPFLGEMHPRLIDARVTVK